MDLINRNKINFHATCDNFNTPEETTAYTLGISDTLDYIDELPSVNENFLYIPYPIGTYVKIRDKTYRRAIVEAYGRITGYRYTTLTKPTPTAQIELSGYENSSFSGITKIFHSLFFLDNLEIYPLTKEEYKEWKNKQMSLIKKHFQYSLINLWRNLMQGENRFFADMIAQRFEKRNGQDCDFAM